MGERGCGASQFRTQGDLQGGGVVFEGDQTLRGDTGEEVPTVTRESLGRHLMSERELSLISVMPVWVSHHFLPLESRYKEIRAATGAMGVSWQQGSREERG